jgi:WhiB family transcriptional regulator, redox-sensing transcriptional regulator
MASSGRSDALLQGRTGVGANGARILTPWRLLAACRSADPDLFFPVSVSGRSLEQVTEAKAICSGCPVRQECLAFALGTGQLHGIWGGASEQERHLMGGSTCTRT